MALSLEQERSQGGMDFIMPVEHLPNPAPGMAPWLREFCLRALSRSVTGNEHKNAKGYKNGVFCTPLHFYARIQANERINHKGRKLALASCLCDWPGH